MSMLRFPSCTSISPLHSTHCLYRNTLLLDTSMPFQRIVRTLSLFLSLFLFILIYTHNKGEKRGPCKCTFQAVNKNLNQRCVTQVGVFQIWNLPNARILVPTPNPKIPAYNFQVSTRYHFRSKSFGLKFKFNSTVAEFLLAKLFSSQRKAKLEEIKNASNLKYIVLGYTYLGTDS